VRRLRLKLQNSQHALAKKAGVAHRTSAGTIEHSQHDVAIFNIERTAAAVGVSTASLLTTAPTQDPKQSFRKL
jgi:transcriptional regulator with XRE-family HTH domain